MKRCTKCLEIKVLTEYYSSKITSDGKRYHCKTCIRTQSSEYTKNNPRKGKRKSYYTGPTEKLREYNRNYYHNRISTDLNFKLAHNLRSRLNRAIRGKSKWVSAVKDLGCQIEDLKLYLEQLFLPGMTWENYGDWEIDHIKPLSSFNLNNSEEAQMACHFTNLQPLWKTVNRQKFNK